MERGWRVFLTMIVLGLGTSPAAAIVDMKASNYSETWNDIEGSPDEPIAVSRTYNSRTLFNGMFGYGWCSDFETALDVIAPGAIRIRECGAGEEALYFPRGYDPAMGTGQLVGTIMARVRERRPDLSEEYLTSLQQDMNTDELLWREFSRRLNFVFYPMLDLTYFRRGNPGDTIRFDGHQFIRNSGGNTTTFDILGRLIAIQSHGGSTLTLKYESGRLLKVVSSTGAQIAFSHDSPTGKVSRLSTSKGRTVVYKTRGDDLIEVVDSNGRNTRYDYDSNHNLIRITFPDGQHVELTYNVEKDWVTSFRDQKGCLESYSYEMAPSDGRNHFWSTVKKVCGEKVTNDSKYEFFHRYASDGQLFLYMMNAEVNGKQTHVVYNVYGRPLSIEREGAKSEYEYDPLQRAVLIRTNGAAELRAYESSCPGATLRQIESLDTHAAEWVRIRYDPSTCVPIYVSSSQGEMLVFSHGADKHHVEVLNKLKQRIALDYDRDIRNPEEITIEGVGSAKITYKEESGGYSLSAPESSAEQISVLSSTLKSIRLLLPTNIGSN
jgi:YD repeat-containing protein